VTVGVVLVVLEGGRVTVGSCSVRWRRRWWWWCWARVRVTVEVVVVVGGGGDGWAESSGVTVGSRRVVAEVVGGEVERGD